MRSFDGRVAAVTGAASGIGRELAVELAGRGCHLSLCDVDIPGLEDTVSRCEGRGVKVLAERVDVANRDAMFAWADRVATDHGRVNLVVNNAGVAVVATAEGASYEDFEWLMGINFWGVVHGTKAFLPHLKASGEGHIVNISSVFGLMAIPGQSVYNSAKFAVRGFTEALRMELEIERAPVSATVVHPGGIRTNIARNARMDPSMQMIGEDVEQARDQFHRIARTSPEKAARVILAAVEADRRRVLVGPDAKVLDLLSRLPSGLYQKVLVTGARRQRR